MRRRRRGRWGRWGLFLKTFRAENKILSELHNLGVNFPQLQIFRVKALNQNLVLTFLSKFSKFWEKSLLNPIEKGPTLLSKVRTDNQVVERRFFRQFLSECYSMFSMNPDLLNMYFHISRSVTQYGFRK